MGVLHIEDPHSGDLGPIEATVILLRNRGVGGFEDESIWVDQIKRQFSLTVSR